MAICNLDRSIVFFSTEKIAFKTKLQNIPTNDTLQSLLESLETKKRDSFPHNKTKNCHSHCCRTFSSGHLPNDTLIQGANIDVTSDFRNVHPANRCNQPCSINHTCKRIIFHNTPADHDTGSLI